MKRSISLFAGLVLAAAACGSGSTSAPSPSTLALVDVVVTTSSTVVPTTTTWPSFDRDQLAYAADLHGDVFLPAQYIQPTTSTTASLVVTAKPAATTPRQPTATTTASAGKPAVTQPTGGPKNPSSLYIGVLGTYSLDQVHATSPIAKPTTAAGTLPLLGTVGSSPNRPAVVVKVDNSSKARPQTGLNKADIVIEEEVEFGITRLAAVFHSNDSTVGPVRSGRSTDISFLSGFGTPALAYSGANSVIDQLLLNQTQVSNFSAARSSGYWRSKDRRAPSNLYTKTSSFSSIAPGGAPPAQFFYRPAGVASTQGIEDTSFGVNYPANKVRWEWNGAGWVRYQAGNVHTTDAEPANAANVVVVAVNSGATGLFDSTGAPVPEYVFVGEGPAAVFTNGRRIDGRWVRPTLRDPAILHVNGLPITLTPGRTWIQVTTSGQYQQ